MAEKERPEGMLSPYRVLDLTDEKGMLCGKLLGDLGADVIKIEKPGGDSARKVGPFYQDDPAPEKSLFWWAYNTSKRGITLNIEADKGKDIFKKLVKTADFIIESLTPGYMDDIGLGYTELSKVNPGLIMVSISYFGQTGSYRHYKAPDIVSSALSGVADQFNSATRPPYWIGYHSQADLNGAVEAAGAAMIALYHRAITGKGNYIDVSTRETLARASSTDRMSDRLLRLGLLQKKGEEKKDDTKEGKESAKKPQEKGGGGIFGGAGRVRRIWPCKDGYVLSVWWSGPNAKRWNTPIVEWLDSKGAAGYLKEFDWDKFDWRTVTQEQLDRMEEPTYAFFLRHTKKEILEGALKYGAMVYPLNTMADNLENEQLAERKFWLDVEHPELGKTFKYPGAFGILSETKIGISRRAPLIGEHNQEIYEKDLSLSREDVQALRKAGII